MNWAIRGVGTSLLGYSLLTAFLFSPALEAAAQTAGTFIPAGYMTAARGGHTAVLLPNGKVLIIEGRTDGTTSAELESGQLMECMHTKLKRITQAFSSRYPQR